MPLPLLLQAPAAGTPVAGAYVAGAYVDAEGIGRPAAAVVPVLQPESPVRPLLLPPWFWTSPGR